MDYTDSPKRQYEMEGWTEEGLIYIAGLRDACAKIASDHAGMISKLRNSEVVEARVDDADEIATAIHARTLEAAKETVVEAAKAWHGAGDDDAKGVAITLTLYNAVDALLALESKGGPRC